MIIDDLWDWFYIQPVSKSELWLYSHDADLTNTKPDLGLGVDADGTYYVFDVESAASLTVVVRNVTKYMHKVRVWRYMMHDLEMTALSRAVICFNPLVEVV